MNQHRILCAVGDSRTTRLLDAQSGDLIHEMTDHSDFSFSCAWSPDGLFLATANQDYTARLYDIRNLARCLDVPVRGRAHPIRSVHFSPDGRLLIAAEEADFVHCVDLTRHGGGGDADARVQLIDLFGEIAGVAVMGDRRAEAIAVAYMLMTPTAHTWEEFTRHHGVALFEAPADARMALLI